MAGRDPAGPERAQAEAMQGALRAEARVGYRVQLPPGTPAAWVFRTAEDVGRVAFTNASTKVGAETASGKRSGVCPRPVPQVAEGNQKCCECACV